MRRAAPRCSRPAPTSASGPASPPRRCTPRRPRCCGDWAKRAGTMARPPQRRRSPRAVRVYEGWTTKALLDLEAALEEIRIPNQATYSPVSLTDVIVAAPLVSRHLLSATLPGRVLQLAAIGAYAGSALQDWTRRQGVRKVDFLREFGADVRNFDLM